MALALLAPPRQPNSANDFTRMDYVLVNREDDFELESFYFLPVLKLFDGMWSPPLRSRTSA